MCNQMCNQTNLSATGPFRVDLCSCGSVHVHLGPAMVRVTPDSLSRLAEAVLLARDRLPAVQRTVAPAADGETTDRN